MIAVILVQLFLDCLHAMYSDLSVSVMTPHQFTCHTAPVLLQLRSHSQITLGLNRAMPCNFKVRKHSVCWKLSIADASAAQANHHQKVACVSASHVCVACMRYNNS